MKSESKKYDPNDVSNKLLFSMNDIRKLNCITPKVPEANKGQRPAKGVADTCNIREDISPNQLSLWD